MRFLGPTVQPNGWGADFVSYDFDIPPSLASYSGAQRRHGRLLYGKSGRQIRGTALAAIDLSHAMNPPQETLTVIHQNPTDASDFDNFDTGDQRPSPFRSIRMFRQKRSVRVARTRWCWKDKLSARVGIS